MRDTRRPVTAWLNQAVPPVISIDDHIERVRVEGERLAAVVAVTSWDARVPGCPDWDVEGLVRHMGDVHRWAGMIVRERLPERPRRDFDRPEDTGALLDWYREGHAQLLGALAGASPADSLWAWAPAPSPLAFWARRQAHETAMHRLDAEQAAGMVTPFPARDAADGVDEWLLIASARAKVPDGDGRTLHLTCTDTGDNWLVALRADGLYVQRGVPGGDCAVSAPASELFALVMNRRVGDGLDVEGDTDVLRTWREGVRF